MFTEHREDADGDQLAYKLPKLMTIILGLLLLGKQRENMVREVNPCSALKVCGNIVRLVKRWMFRTGTCIFNGLDMLPLYDENIEF